jgi:hypothetical protein
MGEGQCYADRCKHPEKPEKPVDTSYIMVLLVKAHSAVSTKANAPL